MASKRHAKKPGRRCKIDSKMIERMKSYLMAGLSLTDACNLLEINRTTWYRFEKEHDGYATKRKSWQNMLKAQAQINIANKVMNEKDPEYSTWWIEHEEKLEDKKATNELTRAKSKQIRAQTKMQEQQMAQVNSVADQTFEKMSELTTEQLIALSHIADNEGGDVSDTTTNIE